MPNCYSEPSSEKRLFARNNGECRDSQLLKGLRVSDERVLNKTFAALPFRLCEHCGHGSGNYMRDGRLWRVAAQCYLPSMAKPLIAFCFMAAIAACTRLDLARVNQRSIDEGTDSVLTLLSELVSGLQRRGPSLSSAISLLLSPPISNRLFNNQSHTNCPSETLWVIK